MKAPPDVPTLSGAAPIVESAPPEADVPPQVVAMPRLSLMIVLLLISPLPFCQADGDNQPADIPTLIEQLDDADFARRESAVQQLGKLGRTAIDPLVEAAAGTSPEVTSRAVNLLERMMESDDPQTVDAADAALVSLLSSDDPQAASLAQSALARKAVVREQRAIEKIKQLGGQVQIGPQVDAFGQPLPGLSLAEAREARPRKFLVGRDWKGGVEGLEHFRRLAHISALTIYVEKASGVPLERVQALASVLPGLMVHHRGPLLGVEANPNEPDACNIRRATPGGPADKAGLQGGDRVLALEDRPVRMFEDLVDALMKYEAGETVTLRIERQGEIIDVDVELEAWTLPPVEDAPSRP